MSEQTTERQTPQPPKAKWPWLLAAGALIGAALIVYVVLRLDSKPAASAQRGETYTIERLANPPPQPATAFLDATGAKRTLADWRGKVVVVNLWATWCAPCVHEMPTLAALADELRAKGGEVLAISVDKEPEAASKTLAQLSGGKLAFYNEPTYAIAFDAQAPGFPVTIIYDKQGRELARVSGGADWTAGAPKELVLKAMQGS
ncbi:MAG: TlpA family protein disulfide reductase [Hyphomonadaceae bacterium]